MVSLNKREAVANSLAAIATGQDVHFDSFHFETVSTPLEEVHALAIKSVQMSDQGLGKSNSLFKSFRETRMQRSC